MITDRISLNIALKYLKQFHQNEGPVIDILFSYKDQLRSTTRTIKFPNIETLEIFVTKYAPLTAFQDIDCRVSYLYELRTFCVLKNGTDKNLIYNDSINFVSRSKNINGISLINLNANYLTTLQEIINAFTGIKINEYILEQEGYIDCGYIETHDPAAIEELKTLYNKYKQI
jgi:hypothetical protein